MRAKGVRIVADEIYREKLAQAGALLGEQGIDCWCLFVRETGTLSDPSLPLLGDLSFTWEAAILVRPDGRHTVVAARPDCQAVQASGLFPEVVGYTEGISGVLREVFARHDPQRI